MLKKIYFVFLLIIFLLFSVYGQKKDVSFQLVVGPTFPIPKDSYLAPSVDGGPHVKTKLNVGFFLEPDIRWDFSQHFFAEGGFAFTMNRYKLDEEVGYTFVDDGTRTVTSIRTPVKIGYLFGSDKTLSISLGFFTNIILSAKEKGDRNYDFTGITVIDPEVIPQEGKKQSFDIDTKDNYKSVGLGALIQLQKEFYISETNIGFVFIRFNQYFSTFENPDHLYSPADKEKNPQSVELGFGLRF